MKKRLFGTLLMGAMFIASMSMFTSCKDYDDDINKNKDAISALQQTVGTLESKLAALESTHNKDIQDLNTKISSLNAAIEKANNEHATKVELQNAVAALEKSIADLAAIAATKEALAEAQKLLDEKKADKTALEELQKTLAAADADLQLQIDGIKKVDSDQDIAIAAAQKQLENQQKAIDELKKALEGKADLAEFNKLKETVAKNGEAIEKNATAIGNNAKAIEALQKKLEGIDNVKKYIDDIKSGLDKDIAKLREDMNKADQKVRDDLGQEIAILTLYVDRILNSIVLRPTDYVDGIEAIDVPMLLYQDVLFINNDKLLARGNAGENWNPKKGKNQGTPTDIHWINHLATLIPNMTYLWNEKYGTGSYNWLDPGISAIDGMQYIHILPATGKEFDDYESYESYQAHAYYNVNPSNPDLEGATFSFDVNYPNVTLAVPSKLTKDMFDEELIYPVNPDADSYDIIGGVMDVPFQVNLSEYINFYAKAFINARTDWTGSTANGRIEQYLHLNEQTMQIPFAAATITKTGASGVERSVNSDWGAITPSFMQLIAIADNAPETLIAPSWSLVDRNRVEANHLYKTAADAINGAATHEVAYNETLDLKPFIETHVARFGTSFSRDGILDERTFEEMGLEYRYEYVDYTSLRYKTEQSKHANPDVIANGIVDPCGVDDVKGEPWADRHDAISSVGREPLVRVRVVHINQNTGAEQTLLVGYIKVRIVEEKAQVFETEATVQDDLYMNCVGVGALKWYQIENYIYEKMKMSKATFEATYELDEDKNPATSTGAYRFVKINGAWVNEADYVKTLADQYMNTTMTLEQLIQANEEFAHAYFKAFPGVIHYTDVEGWNPYGTGDDDQAKESNVIYWGLGASWNAHAHAFADGTYVDAETDQKYVQYLAKPDADGNSTEALTTTIRFVRKADKTAPLYVTITIPAGKIHWPVAKLSNKSFAYWYNFNSDQQITVNTDSAKALAQEIHVNLPQPGTTGTYSSTFTVDQKDFAFNLLKAFEKQTVKWAVTNVGKFGMWKNINDGKDQGNVQFWLTYPQAGKNTTDFNANREGKINGQRATTWTAKGFSGTTYTLALANSTDGVNFTYTEVIKNIANVEIGEQIKHLVGETVTLRNGNYIVAYDPVAKKIVPIVSLKDAADVATTDYVTIVETAPQNEFIKYYYNEVAEDLVNYMGRTSDGYLTSSKQQLGQNETFTAYLQAKYVGGCYDYNAIELLDPTNSNYFNARFERPVNLYPLQINVSRDALDDGAVVKFNDFIFKTAKNAAKKWYFSKSAFTDWRGYYCVPTYNYAEIPADVKKVYGKYYDIELDNANGAATNFHGGAKFADITIDGDGNVTGGYKFTDDVRKIIKTDVSKTADGRATLSDKNAINALPFACNDANGDHEAVKLEVNAAGDLVIYNNGINVNNFNLYVPIFYSYVLGDENEHYTYKYFRSAWNSGDKKLGKGMVWGVINVSNTHGNK